MTRPRHGPFFGSSKNPLQLLLEAELVAPPEAPGQIFGYLEDLHFFVSVNVLPNDWMSWKFCISGFKH